jgi:tetratricopeptide (TPR) repeat protein
MTLKHKAFLTALSLITSESRKAKAFLTDKRMSQQEKTILSGFLALRDFENSEVIAVLEKFESSDQFVESQRHYCLGAAYNNLTLFKQAEFHLDQAIKLNNFDNGMDRKISACQSLFTVYLNSYKLDGMERVLNYLKSIRPANKRLLLTRAYCEFSYTVQKKDFKLALNQVPMMEQIYPELNEHQSISYLYDLFELYLIENNYEMMGEALDRMKHLKKFKNPTHVKYMQTLLKCLAEGTPLYLYEKDFQDYPYLLNQLLCLQALERGDQKKALAVWENLRALHPELYFEPFNYRGPLCLFERCLEKFQHGPQNVDLTSGESSTSREEKLVHLLKGSHLPVQKELLYEAIWGRSVDSKDDLKKLVKVVQRAREKFSVDIKSVKGSYALIKNKAS